MILLGQLLYGVSIVDFEIWGTEHQQSLQEEIPRQRRTNSCCGILKGCVIPPYRDSLSRPIHSDTLRLRYTWNRYGEDQINDILLPVVCRMVCLSKVKENIFQKQIFQEFTQVTFERFAKQQIGLVVQHTFPNLSNICHQFVFRLCSDSV